MADTQKAPGERKLLTVAQVARLMGVSHQRVYQYIDDGRLPTIPPRQVLGGVVDTEQIIKYLIDPADVERLQHELETEPNVGGRPPKARPVENT